MEISVIGLGKLGLCTACCLAGAGLKVIGMDNREAYIRDLKNGHVPFNETGLKQALHDAQNNLEFTDQIDIAVTNSECTFIIVPTLSQPDGRFSNNAVLSVIKAMIPALKEKEAFHLINVVSTVMPGSNLYEFAPCLEQGTGKKIGKELGLAYNPEFIAIGSVINDFLNPDLVLIGESDAASGSMLKKIYTQVCTNSPSIERMSLTNAEITKLAINCYCTMKISFANNLAALCEKYGDGDAGVITKAAGNDSRIGHKYFRPGLGFGGPCFPRDNQAFMAFAREIGGYQGLQEAVLHINDQQVQRAIDKIRNAAAERGPIVALLGQSYKPQTYLVEESQAMDILRGLAQFEGLQLRSFDPMANEQGNWTLCEDLTSCVEGAHVVGILTPWPEFFESSWRTLLAPDGIIIDLWD